MHYYSKSHKLFVVGIFRKSLISANLLNWLQYWIQKMVPRDFEIWVLQLITYLGNVQFETPFLPLLCFSSLSSYNHKNETSVGLKQF